MRGEPQENSTETNVRERSHLCNSSQNSADDGSRQETYPAPCSQYSFDFQTQIQGETYEYKYKESGHTSVLSPGVEEHILLPCVSSKRLCVMLAVKEAHYVDGDIKDSENSSDEEA